MKKTTMLTILLVLSVLLFLFSGYASLMKMAFSVHYEDVPWFTATDPSSQYALKVDQQWPSSFGHLHNQDYVAYIYCVNLKTDQTVFYLKTSLTKPNYPDKYEQYKYNWQKDGVELTLIDNHMQPRNYVIKWKDVFPSME